MRRFRSPRRFVTRVTPSYRHTLGHPAPIEGCKCDVCEDKRADLETERIERVMGSPDDDERKGA